MVALLTAKYRTWTGLVTIDAPILPSFFCLFAQMFAMRPLHTMHVQEVPTLQSPSPMARGLLGRGARMEMLCEQQMS